MSRPSLARRLLVLVMALVGLTWLGAAVYTWIDVRHELDELFDGHLAQAAALLVVQAADFHEDDDDEVPESPVLHRYAPHVAFQVFHEDRLVRRSANAPVQPMVAAGARTDHGFARVRIDGEPWRVFVARGAESDVRVYVGEHEVVQHRVAVQRVAQRVRRSPVGPQAQVHRAAADDLVFRPSGQAHEAGVGQQHLAVV